MSPCSLARDIFDRESADRAALLFCAFPGAVVLSLAYGESFMIAFAAACLLLLRRRRWFWAGVAAALAGATRATGLLLVPCCVWAAGVAIARRRQWWSLLAPVVAPSGALAFYVYLQVHTGDWTIWFESERRGWGHRTDWGHGSIHTLSTWFSHPLSDPQVLLISLGTILAVAGLVLVWRARLPLTVTLFAVLVVGLSFTSPDLQLKPRFVLTAFPLFVAAGYALSKRVAEGVAVAFAGGLGVLTVLYGLQSFTPQPLFP